jgi:NADH:ubiquinone oxidoreductase subunit 2 (subunit N)
MTVPADQKTSQPAGRLQASFLRRLTVIAAAAFILLLADALYMQFSNYQQGTFNNFHLNDAATVFIAAGFLAVITLVLLGLSWRAGRDER